MQKSKIFRNVQASILREAEELDIDTTVSNQSGSTEQASGANPNAAVTTNQTAQDAGADHPTDVPADRVPGDVPSEVDSPTTLGAQAEPTVDAVRESSNTSALFAGCFVRVLEKNTKKTVDRGVVARVSKQVVTLEGNEDYAQDKYDFIRLA